jgi:hypothetical protein
MMSLPTVENPVIDLTKSDIGRLERMKHGNGSKRPRWQIKRYRNPHDRYFHQDQTDGPLKISSEKKTKLIRFLR